MKRVLYLIVAGLTLFAGAFAPAPAAAIQIERVVSPGGIEAWLVREPSLPVIAWSFAFGGGANEDPEPKPGTGHMVASLLDDGAGELDSKAFQRRVEETATELRFSVGRDHFNGSIRMLRDRQDASLDLLRLALNQPRFDADATERVRAQILAGLRRDATNPNTIANRTWWRTAFEGHPYGRPNNGTTESVPTITAEDLRSYAQRVFTRGNLKITAVGDIDAATLGRALDRVFGGLPANGQATKVADVAFRGGERRVVVQLDVPQSVMRLGGRGVARKDPDFIPAYLVNHVLGGGSFTSRLYNEVREKRGLAYGVSSYLLSYEHTALFMASTQASADRTSEALEVIEAQIARMATEGPTEEELGKAKAYIKGSYPLNFDTSRGIANVLLQIQLDELGIDYINRRSGLIDAVTIADAKRVAKRLGEGGMLVTIVGRPKGLSSKEPGG
jgi:zinc protease